MDRRKGERRSRRVAQTQDDGQQKSINPVKKRIRDVKRLLEHAEKLPAGVRQEHERELSSLTSELQEREDRSDRSRMIAKYHMVRFFERRKADRFLKKARRKLSTVAELSGKEKSAIEKEAHNREVDLQYTYAFPLRQAYVGLYGKGKDDMRAADKSRSKVQEMWSAVEAAMAAGTLEQLREGPPLDRPTVLNLNHPPKAKPRQSKVNGMPERSRKSELAEGVAGPEDDDNDDGVGFFEF